MNRDNQVLISFRNVYAGYKKRQILNDINLDIFNQDFLGIIGPNGSGKTTFLKSLLGIIKPVKGEIKHHSPDISFGYVIQRQFVDEVFPLTAREIVSMGRYGKRGICRGLKKEDWSVIDWAMEIAGVVSLSDQSFRNLSGGQRQRVLVARALASEANMLILDEPTNDLDIKGVTEIMELIRAIHKEQKVTVIIVSHLLNNITNYVNKLAFIKDSNIVVQTAENALTDSNLSNIFECRVNVHGVGGEKVIIHNEYNNRNI